MKRQYGRVGRSDHSLFSSSGVPIASVIPLRVVPPASCSLARAHPSVASAGMAHYAEAFEIVIRGRLSPSLVAALGEFQVRSVTSGQTLLVGCVTDQAQLHSALETLRDLNIELVCLNRVDGGSDLATAEIRRTLTTT